MYPGCTDGEIAAFAHVSRKRVERIRYKLGLRKYETWTPDMVQAVAEMHDEGLTWQEIAAENGKTAKAMWGAASRYGLSTPRAGFFKPMCWSKEELAALDKLGKGLTPVGEKDWNKAKRKAAA